MVKTVKAKSAKTKKPRALPNPRKTGTDKLSLIKGIGSKIQGQLNEFGIFHFDQIADWKKPECNWVNEHLKFNGRIEREEWVKQAKALAKSVKKNAPKVNPGEKAEVAKTNKSDVTKSIKAAAGKSKVAEPVVSKNVTLEKSQKNISGYGSGGVETIISVEAVTREVAKMSDGVPDATALIKLANDKPFLSIENLKAGYGQMEILHDFNLFADKGQSLCLIGPNGAGKSTVLHSIFGFTSIFSGNISVSGREITHQKPKDKLKTAGIAYILQDNSVFPNMTVEENLWMGGFLKDRSNEAKEAAEWVFQKYDRLAKRRSQPARVLSGGERRLLEISRALVMNPEILLVDEPSIGLEP
ncbi:MAG: ATP-binding cassette domain-containing protein, partial [Hyphomicrobiales bacterium]|nr:ATP-binding cassette domain-containing protein [Hyphomicrobiales bacterium]